MTAPIVPGEVALASSPVLLAGEVVGAIDVLNIGDRPIQVGSHYHLAEANAALRFDRARAWGCRLAIPAGTAVRFEPGIERTVELVPLAGRRTVPGLRGIAGGPLDPAPGDPGPGGSAQGAPGATGEAER